MLPGLPVVQALKDLEGLNPFDPALVLVPASLLRGTVKLIECLPAQTPEGVLARGIELQLVGLEERDTSVLASGVMQTSAVLIQMLDPRGGAPAEAEPPVLSADEFKGNDGDEDA